jgi:hypothetical protein
MRYLIETPTREQAAGEDPFGGHGRFLPFPGLSIGEISDAMAEAGLGLAPSFIWEGIGAWVEAGRAGGA